MKHTHEAEKKEAVCFCSYCKCNRAFTFDCIGFDGGEKHRCIACGHLYAMEHTDTRELIPVAVTDAGNAPREYTRFKLVEKNDHLAVHGLFLSRFTAERHLKNVIPIYVARRYFIDKTLTVEDFEIIEA